MKRPGLQQTFLMLPRIGEAREAEFWSAGILDWYQFQSQHTGLKGPWSSDVYHDLIQESILHFQRRDWHYFNRHIPAVHRWRALAELSDKAMCIDIETGWAEQPITVLGIYDGRTYQAYIQGMNLEQGLEKLEEADLIISYNGIRFDLPMIVRTFPYHLINAVHLDLLPICRKYQFRGGLKAVERLMGLERSEAISQLKGQEAPRLWRAYEEGRQEALDLLIEYNRADTENLWLITEYLLKHCLEPDYSAWFND